MRDHWLAPARRWWSAALVCLLAVVMLGAADSTDRYGRIGHNLICTCGVCGEPLLECNHVGCPDAARMRHELQEQIDGPNGNGADSLILNWFIAKYGATVLAAPIRGGFDNVAWALPAALFLFGTVGTGLLVRRWLARKSVMPAAAGMHGTDLPVDDAMRERIRREAGL